MDQSLIGKFIAACRKEKHLTQAQLAERLGISDRAVSKWETGRSMPDSSIMLELCDILDITVNDLLTGRRTTMENYKAEAERNLLMMRKSEEASARTMLNLEIVIGFISVAAFILCLCACFTVENTAWRIGFICGGTAVFLVGMCSCVNIEAKAGYYECAECGHKYVPSFGAALMAPHVNRTRKMRCPECGKVSWQKKTVSK